MDIDSFCSVISKHEVFCIEYCYNHEFTISNIEYPSEEYGGTCFDCWYIDRDGEPVNEERTFKVDKVERITASYVEDDDDTSEFRFIWLTKRYDTLFMGYTNAEGEYHEMNISDIEYPSNQYGSGYFEAFCIDEDGEPEGVERTFKISRIDFIEPSDEDEFDEDDN